MSPLSSGRRVELAVAALSLASSLALAAPPAGAHLPGAAPLYAFGNATLAPWGEPNFTIHAFMDQMGLPPSVGDRLEIEFAVDNGTGPPIVFEIHTHAGASGYRVYYNESSAALKDSWTVAENASYMVYFENPYNFSVFLSYNFVLLAPTPATSALLFIFPATAGVALGWFFFVRAGRGLPPQGEGGEAGDEDDEDSSEEGEPEPGPERGPTPEAPPGP